MAYRLLALFLFASVAVGQVPIRASKVITDTLVQRAGQFMFIKDSTRFADYGRFDSTKIPSVPPYGSGNLVARGTLGIFYQTPLGIVRLDSTGSFVTSVTASNHLSSTGGFTPNISMSDSTFHTLTVLDTAIDAHIRLTSGTPSEVVKTDANRYLITTPSDTVGLGAALFGKLATDTAGFVKAIYPTANQTTVSKNTGTVIVGTVQDISTTSSPSFSSILVDANQAALGIDDFTINYAGLVGDGLFDVGTALAGSNDVWTRYDLFGSGAGVLAIHHFGADSLTYDANVSGTVGLNRVFDFSLSQSHLWSPLSIGGERINGDIVTITTTDTAYAGTAVRYGTIVDQPSRGDTTQVFTGSGGHDVYIFEDTTGGAYQSDGYRTFNRKRGVLVGERIQLRPLTENIPYNINRDVTGLIISNIGTRQGTEGIYIAGSPTKLTSAANPNRYSWFHSILLGDTVQKHLFLEGSANIGLDMSTLGYLGSNARAIQTTTLDTSSFGTIWSGTNSGKHQIEVQGNGMSAGLNLTAINSNKNVSTQAQSEDTSAITLNFTGTGKPQLTLKSTDGTTVTSIDSTGAQIHNGTLTNVAAVSVYGKRSIYTLSPASRSSSAFVADEVESQIGASSDTISKSYGAIFLSRWLGAKDATLLQGFQGIGFYGSTATSFGTITDAIGVEGFGVNHFSNNPTGTITNATSIIARNQKRGGSNLTITNSRGVVIEDQTLGTNNTNLLIGSPTTGNWSIYNNSSNANYFAGNTSIGSTTTTSLLNVGSAAQFQVNSTGHITAPDITFRGVTPAVTGGAVGWDSTNRKFVGTEYQVQRAFSMNHAVIVADVVDSNSAAEVTIDSIPMAANFPSVGKVVQVHLFGIYTLQNPQTFTMRLRHGGPTGIVMDSAITGAGLVTDKPWNVVTTQTFRTIGATGSVIGRIDLTTNGSIVVSNPQAAVTVNTTISNTIYITVQFTATGNNKIRLRQGWATTIN